MMFNNSLRAFRSAFVLLNSQSIRLTAALFSLLILFSQCAGDRSEQSGDSQKTISLKDGTKVHLNKQSVLDYSSDFGTEERKVKLNGEAFFEINHDPAKPFIITTDGVETISTKGGKMNVQVDPKNILVNIQTGELIFTPSAHIGDINMTSGMEAEFNRKTGGKRVLKKGSMNGDTWRTNVIEFYETPLRYVLDDLKNIYNVQFSGSSRELMDCTFTFRTDQENLDTVLAKITEVFGIQFERRNEKTIILSGGSCSNN